MNWLIWILIWLFVGALVSLAAGNIMRWAAEDEHEKEDNWRGQ